MFGVFSFVCFFLAIQHEDIMPFRISTAAGDTISGKNTDTVTVYSYFLLTNWHNYAKFHSPLRVRGLEVASWTISKKCWDIFFCPRLNTKRSINISLKVFYPVLTKSFFEHYCHLSLKISYCWKGKEKSNCNDLGAGTTSELWMTAWDIS